MSNAHDPAGIDWTAIVHEHGAAVWSLARRILGDDAVMIAVVLRFGSGSDSAFAATARKDLRSQGMGEITKVVQQRVAPWRDLEEALGGLKNKSIRVAEANVLEGTTMKGTKMSDNVESKPSATTPSSVLALGVCWTGAAVATYASNDPDATFAAIAAACYLIWKMYRRVLEKTENRLWTP